MRRKGRIVSIGANGDGFARMERSIPRWWNQRSETSDPRFSSGRRAAAMLDDARTNIGPLGTVTSAKSQVGGLKEPADYVAGGPIYHDRSTDTTLLVYHAEHHFAEDPQRFYATLGLACSRDGGRSFCDLGRIVSSELTQNAAARSPRPVEMGPGTLLLVDGYLMVLFRDFRNDYSRVNLAAARAPLVEVLTAAQRGDGVEWRKFDGTRFTEPGLGGHPGELLPIHSPYNGIEWADAIWLESKNCWAMVTSAVYFDIWSLTVTLSTDGLHWSPPAVVQGSRSREEALYVSLTPTLSAQDRVETGPDGLIAYRVVSASGGFDRWSDARLERLVLQPAN